MILRARTTALLALLFALWAPGSLPLSQAAPPQEEGALSKEAISARSEARQILALPIFRRGTGVPLSERLGRVVMRLLKRAGEMLHRAVGIEHGTALATGVSCLVLASVAAFLWRLRRRHPAPASGDIVPAPAGGSGAAGRKALPLSAAEEAYARGDLAEASALVTDWFLARAFEPEPPPGWRTNRELLPDLRALGPLRPRDWDALVGFHEALRYAGSLPETGTVRAWLQRAREVQA